MYRKFYISLSLIAALILLAYTLFSAYREVTPEWKKYQIAYKNLFIKNAKYEAIREKAESLEIGIQQIYLGTLKRVDRCTNCHMGVENPLMFDEEIPYKQHSGTYLKDHPVDKFGCTVCHFGQGRATNLKEAHGLGHDAHWDYPIVPLKYIQSSCAQCHDFEMLKQNGAGVVVRGEELFREKGCKGCHKLNNIGGTLGKALDGVGSQPFAYFPMKHVQGEKTVYSWLKQHFDSPQKIVPESWMKLEIKGNEADILTTYMLTLRSDEISREYRRIRHVEREPDGEALFRMYCIGCHSSLDSVNDEILKQTIPAIMNPAFRRTSNIRFLNHVIREGRKDTFMTAWKTDAAGLSYEEINRIAVYITNNRPDEDKPSVRGEIVAKRILKDIPDDPEDGLWKYTKAFRVPLMLISQKTDPNVKALSTETEEQPADPLTGFINVKALYNNNDIAFLVEWEDATRNVLMGVDTFRDGVALQFPVNNESEPTYRMGKGKGKDTKGMVNIWFWKADVQESIDQGAQQCSQGPVENLVAAGFGTLTLKDRSSQNVFGNGKWKKGKWNVVLKRTFRVDESNAIFTIGKFTPVSFAVWDGQKGNVDGSKVVSTWFYVILEG